MDLLERGRTLHGRTRGNRSAPERMARAPGAHAAQRQLLMQVLPKAGFSSPITEIVLPQTFTGTCTGT